MAKFTKAPSPDGGSAAAGGGWDGDFLDRLGQFWAESGDAFSPFTRMAFLALAGLIVTLIVRGIYRTFAARRRVPEGDEADEA